MSRPTVTFNGTDLTASYVVSDLRNSLLPRTMETTEVPGMDGSLVTGVRLAPRTITLTLTARGATPAARQTAARTLASTLAVSEPKALALSIDGGIYYMAVPVSDGDGERFMNSTSFDVAFKCPDPVAYGELKTLTIPAGGSLTFTVAGTYPTMPTTSVSVTPTSENRLWKLALDDGTYLAYEMGGTFTTARTIVTDSQARTLTVGGATRLLVPDGDWLVLTPGQHTLTNEGTATTGATTVTYRERWL